ncbi:LLM class F420-dependent oxidoreductase [Rhodococcus sp. 06-462-5]|uniref:TIGR03620 family F420-dependent LLM class oxidoreductase n=1 Tax=Nocardiaceae TaxID=85025 RepID=UPI00050BF379|nr:MULTISPECIES: TIGR03620 family F420-dependent LLM class oxidoreductase [Rhodococcus]OZC74016.1 LLM class F420-dependent oxidoreductase [Rhodococcus sp. 06-462-5]OZE68012.1 LLM class F420-dependent oxidoreductase [Rhodococcus sp. 02-925g]OZF51966.1 LLM class F420-dependent oxidoreductase [Rhodococcus sp. 14-1411-2a]
MTTKPGTTTFPSKIGVWWNSEPWPIADAQNMVREIEALGYGSLFMPEGSGKDVMVQSAAFLGATESLVVGTGIANVHVRIPTAAESGARTLTALYPGRFVLGLGVSHAPFVEGSLGGEYRKPLSMMRTYLERMNSVPSGLEPGARPTRLLAALGPKMIELSGELADGAHPYLVLPEQTRHTRTILGDDAWIVTEQAIAIGGGDADQLRRARSHILPYSGLDNYRKSWLRQGFEDTDLADGGSERLLRALVGMGSAEDAAASVTAHLDAGADHVVVQVAVDSPADDPLPDLRALATALDL